MILNKRGVSKTAAIAAEAVEGEPVSWISQFGSVTFNYVGREFPMVGINEAGLVVAALGTRWSEYPACDYDSLTNSAKSRLNR